MPNDWTEYHECPYCGAIQELAGPVLLPGTYLCHSCEKQYRLRTSLMFCTKRKEDDHAEE